ncbi:MAG: hypothetical protein ACRCYP_03765 [Alphaproteobacteria bacterium]
MPTATLSQNISDLILPIFREDAGGTAHPDFYHDRSINWFRWKDTKRRAPRQAILNITKSYVEDLRGDLRGIAHTYLDGKDLKKFQRDFAQNIKLQHLQSYIVGKGGIDKMTDADYLAVGREMTKQYKYLRQFALDIAKGKQSEAQILYRSSLYSESARSSYWAGLEAAAIEAGCTMEKNVLSLAEHCEGCLRYAAMGKVEIGKIPPPKRGDRDCKMACLCRKVYYKGNRVWTPVKGQEWV